MSKTKSEDEIRTHKDRSIKILNDYLEDIISTEPKKVDLLSYWLHTYANFLRFEKEFDPKRNKNYKRGDIVRVNLGFNVGSEHGGRHYAVVLDNKNNHASPVVTVIPLSSSDGSDVHPSSVYLGDDIYQKVKAKTKGIMQAYNVELRELNEMESSLLALLQSDNITDEQIATAKANHDLIVKKTLALKEKQNDLKTVQNEISRMKAGSVALVGQITTISKLRIEDPKDIHGALNGIKLSSSNLELIDEKIRTLFLHQ